MTRLPTRRPGRRTTRAGALAATALTACLLGAPSALAADAPFEAAPDIELGSGARGTDARPYDVAVGDFDSDGRQDVAIADGGLNALHIRVGNGDGTFEPRAGTLRRTGAAGANRVRFSGRIGRRALLRGRYRVTVRAIAAAGNRSAVRSAAFRIVR